MQSPAPSLITAFRHSNIVRVLLLFVLVILFQIPIFALDGLIRERQGRRNSAVEEVASKWGRQQAVIGPMLIVPYTTSWTEAAAGGQPVVRKDTHLGVFLPERLSTRGTLDAEKRRRGIFSTSVYRANLHIEGVFARPSLAAWGVDPKDVQWSRAQLVVGISDNRAIESTAAMRWNGAPTEVLPGTLEGLVVTSGVHAEAPVPEAPASLAAAGSRSGDRWARRASRPSGPSPTSAATFLRRGRTRRFRRRRSSRRASASISSRPRITTRWRRAA